MRLLHRLIGWNCSTCFVRCTMLRRSDHRLAARALRLIVRWRMSSPHCSMWTPRIKFGSRKDEKRNNWIPYQGQHPLLTVTVFEEHLQWSESCFFTPCLPWFVKNSVRQFIVTFWKQLARSGHCSSCLFFFWLISLFFLPALSNTLAIETREMINLSVLEVGFCCHLECWVILVPYHCFS